MDRKQDEKGFDAELDSFREKIEITENFINKVEKGAADIKSELRYYLNRGL